LDRVGSWSGLALALALLEQRAREDPQAPPPLVVAVGECVRRGVPTAARASVVSRAPLSGRLADGQVGGDLGLRLACVTDALELRGQACVPAAVLVVSAQGEVRIESRPELAGASPGATHARLRALFGPESAVLCIGPGGERGLPFASLVASGEVPHFVGRGGLGAVLGRCGLKALVVVAPAAPGRPQRELLEALLASPRLGSRAQGGTLELYESFAARGVLDERGRAVGAGLERAREARHGCKGCPTPCGWVLHGPGGRSQGARFGATYALGLRLGLERAEDALALLARCDDAGLDAKELGCGLAVLRVARERGLIGGGPRTSGLADYERWVDELAAGAGQGRSLAAGAAALAAELGLSGELTPLGATPAPPSEDLAAALGAAVAVRGPDPMRTFPFLLHDLGDSAALAHLVAPLPLPTGAEDPRDPAGKGRLVWWHENLVAALDTTGFCSFSAAALLCDGTLELERLAAWIEPEGLRAEGEASAAVRLLAMGEASLHLAHRLDERWRGTGAWEPFAGSAGWLDLPGMWDEYAALRGLDRRGLLERRSRERFDCAQPIADLAALRSVPQPSSRRRAARESGRGRGAVRLHAGGPLGEILGPEAEVELALPATLSEVLEAACRRYPAARESLLSLDRPRVAAYRDGLRVGAGDEVCAGEHLELVLVISGGAR